MIQVFKLTAAVFIMSLTGCIYVPGKYLRPSASEGQLMRVVPWCAGVNEVVAFSAPSLSSILFRVHAVHNSSGTELRMDVYYSKVTDFYPKPSSYNERKVLEENILDKYTISASTPEVTLIMPNGKKEKIKIGKLAEPRTIKYWRGFYGKGVQISHEKLIKFTIEFPTIYINEHKIRVPPVKFTKQTGLVFLC